MTPRDEAIFHIWQIQARAGVKPEDRRLPANDQDSFESDLEVIRKCIERA